MRCLALLCFVVGCGGKAESSSPALDTPIAAAGGSNAVVPSLTIAVPSSGTDGSGPGAAQATCLQPAPTCRLRHSYVTIDDTPSVMLNAPFDAACASCSVFCEDCSFECELSATGSEFCSRVSLKLAVCAGDDQAPPCLNTAVDSPYYVDVNGKKWSVISLSGAADAPAQPALLEADLNLELRDGDTVRELPIHVRVCSDLTLTAAACD